MNNQDKISLACKSILVFCILYTCVGRDWYGYQGHCKGANGTDNGITKGLWEACVEPSGSQRHFCYQVFECNDMGNDPWYSINNITRDFDDRDDDTIFFAEFTRGFILIAFFSSAVSLFASCRTMTSNITPEAKNVTWWTLATRITSISACLCSWAALIFGSLMANSDGRNSYGRIINTNNTDNTPMNFDLDSHHTRISVGQDHHHGFGMTYYFGVVSVVLSTAIGLMTVVFVCKEWCLQCRTVEDDTEHLMEEVDCTVDELNEESYHPGGDVDVVTQADGEDAGEPLMINT